MIFLLLFASSVYAEVHDGNPPLINLGTLSEDALNNELTSIKNITSPQDRIKSISSIFMGIPYGSGTLQSNDGTMEHLVIDFSSLDCFTFIDYVESLRLAHDFDSFKTDLRNVRYKDGDVTFVKRNHFFTDWALTSRVKDITRSLGGDFAVKAEKNLNFKSEGQLYVPGIPVVEREIYYIPSDSFINNGIINQLRTGDYIGIYTDKIGLDVSHVGIAVYDGDKLYFRNASSRKSNMKVVDQLMTDYVRQTKGIVILRPEPVK